MRVQMRLCSLPTSRFYLTLIHQTQRLLSIIKLGMHEYTEKSWGESTHTGTTNLFR